MLFDHSVFPSGLTQMHTHFPSSPIFIQQLIHLQFTIPQEYSHQQNMK